MLSPSSGLKGAIALKVGRGLEGVKAMAMFDEVPKVWLVRGGVEHRGWYHKDLGLSCPFCCVGEVDNAVGARCGCGAVVSRTEEPEDRLRRVRLKRWCRERGVSYQKLCDTRRQERALRA